MKKLLLVLMSLLMTHCTPVLAETYPTHVFPVKVLNVVDADTVDVSIDLGLGLFSEQRIRIKDFDAPETWRPKNEAERSHGEAATERARELLNQGPLKIKVWGWGVYNRVEGNIILPDDRFMKDVLIEEGFEKKVRYE
jgi:endonuclease YncB( thermonuclease family)